MYSDQKKDVQANKHWSLEWRVGEAEVGASWEKGEAFGRLSQAGGLALSCPIVM